MAASKIITWNGSPSTNIPQLVVGQVHRPVLGANRDVMIDIDGREGSYVFSQKRGRKLLIVECFIQVGSDFTERGDAFEDLADWLDVPGDAQLVFSDRPGRYYMASLETPPEPDEWRDVGTFELRWLAQPYLFDNSVTHEVWTSDSDDNHIWDPDILTDLYPVIEISPTNGTLTGFIIESNGNSLTWSGNIASGGFITINSIVPVVVTGNVGDEALTGAYSPANRSMAGVEGDFPVLLPTISNNIHFMKTGGTATSFDIDVAYRKKYRR